MPLKALENASVKSSSRAAQPEAGPVLDRSFQPEGFESILQLQHVWGNRHVTRLLQGQAHAPRSHLDSMQCKLMVGAAGDRNEQEAERVSRQVLNTSEAALVHAGREEDRQKAGGQPAAGSSACSVQPAAAEAQENVQPQHADAGWESFEAGPQVEQQLAANKGGGSPLPDPVRSFMEPRFGSDFGQVRVHTGSAAEEMNRAVDARAFTHGHDIYFGTGQSPSDLALTAHELTHVIQQTGSEPSRPDRERPPLSPVPPTRASTVAAAAVPVLARDGPRGGAAGAASPGGGSGSAAAVPAWTPFVLHGSPAEVVHNIVTTVPRLPNSDPANWLMVFSTGTHLVVYRGARRIGAYRLAEGAGQLPAGVFRVQQHNVQQLWRNTADRHTEWFQATTSDATHVQVDLIVPADRPGYDAAIHDGIDLIIRPEVVSTGAGGGERVGGEGGEGGGQGTGEGGTGETPAIPQWATLQFRVVRDRVAGEKRRLAGMAGSTADEHDPNAVARLLVLGAIPDLVLLGRDGNDVVLGVRVAVQGERGRRQTRQGAIVLKEGQGTELLWGRVQSLTRALYAGLSPTRRATQEDLVLGLPGDGTPPDGEYVPPNTEAYPSEIVNLGANIGIEHNVHRFSMRIDWTVDGEFATFAAFGPRRYQWDIVRLRTAAGSVAGPNDVRHSGRGEGAGAELREGFHEIGEDTVNSVNEEIIDPATATLMATDAGIRSIGTLIGSFVTLASQPSNEQGVQWEGPGTYVVRCISARPPLERDDAPPNPRVRAASIALFPIRVMSPRDMATRLIAATDLRQAEAQLAALQSRLATAPEAERAGLEQQITEAQASVARLRQADQAGMAANLESSDRSIEEQIELAQLLVRLRGTDARPEQWKPSVERWMPAPLRDTGLTPDLVYGMVVGLHVQLALSGRTPETLMEELRRAQDQVRKQRSALAEVSGDLQGPVLRPHMSFVPRLTGQSLPLTMALAEHAGSEDGNRRWTLVDLSTPGHHDTWSGRSRKRGPAGHAEAIRGAITEFAHDVPYGRGTVGIRLPENISETTGGPVSMPEATMEARPGKEARWRQRLESLATAAGAAALVVTGPAGVALGIMGGIAGGIVAAYRIYHRYQGGYLELDLATAMDITAVVGGVVAPAGAWAGSVRATSRWVALADRVETGVRVFGYLQIGSQVFVIPVTLAQELAAIGNDPNLSPGERAARRAMAFLNATNSGLQLAVSAYQMASEHAAGPRVRESGPAGGGAEPAEGGGAPVEGEATPGIVEVPAPSLESVTGGGGEGAGAGGPRPSEGEHGGRAGGGRTTEPTSEGGRPREGEGRTGGETDSSGGRTAGGTAHGGAEGQPGAVADANPAERARPVELLQQRLGQLRRPPRERAAPLTEADLALRPRSGNEAIALYDRAVHAATGQEVGLFYNPNTGEFSVQLGSEFEVGPPAGDGWQAIVHLHPNPENVVVRRMPAPADVLGAAQAAFRTGSHVEFVQSIRPDGTTGLARVEVTVEPRRIVVELPADRPSPGHPGEPARRIEVDSPEAYAREYGAETTHLDPSSPMYQWVMRDLDAFYRARRAGREHGAGSGRTGAGTISPGREGGATGTGEGHRPGEGRTGETAPGAEGPAPGGASETGQAARPTVREGLTQRRADVRARFAEADAAFAQEGGTGPSPTAAFDAAMAVLEAKGMGPDGLAAVEAMFTPGRGQPELSPSRFRRATEVLGRVAELLTARRDLAETAGLDRYEGAVTDLARDLARAYREGRTLDGQPVRNRGAAALEDVMRSVNRAYDEYLAEAAQDPIERLLGLLRLRDAVARAGETLRTYGPGFSSETRVGKMARGELGPGVREAVLDVHASGDISEPIARDLPGVGLEEYMLTPRDLADLPTQPPGLARRLADLLRGWHRAHLIGPGFGAELFEGLMLAPESVNLQAQNAGVEHFIRKAAEAGVHVRLDTHATGRRLEVPLRGGSPEHVDILTRVEYTITGTVGNGDPVTHRVVITVGEPPTGAVTVESTIPEGAAGADVLDQFRRPSPPAAGAR